MRDRAVLGKNDSICRLEKLEIHASNNDSDDKHDNTFILLSSIFYLPILLRDVDEPESSFFSRMTLKLFPSLKKKIRKDIRKLLHSSR